MQKILCWSAFALMGAGLAGCYYPVYPPYPAYGYAPPPQAAAPGPECREYSKSVTIDGKNQQASGTACRQPDGSWKDTANGMPVVIPPPPPPPPVVVAPPPPYVYAPPPPPAMYPPPGYPVPVR